MNGFDSYRVRQRAAGAQWILIAAFVVLLGAFFRTQVLQHDKYQLRAETNRLRSVPLAAPRGTIFDRDGRIIAENVPGYTVKLFAARKDSLASQLDRFRLIVPLDSADVAATLRRFGQTPYQPVTVIGDASFDVVSRLEEHRAVLPGLVIQAEPKRLYPAGKAIAHLIGYVSEVTEGDLATDRYPGAELGTLVGKQGLELQYDSVLRGRNGVRYIEVNARGRLVREQASVAPLLPTPGAALRTTIDLDLQTYIDSIWPEGVRGSMVAMSPKGEVLALYSAPNFDPNAFTGGIPTKLWRQLNTDSARPLYNRAIQARYPPASPFKLATAAMGLKRGLITMESKMPQPCTGGYRLGNRIFKCWKRGGHGNLDLVGAVAASCDVYFYQLGQQLGLPAIIEEGVAMGFKDRTGIDLGNESRPIYPGSMAYFDSLYGPRRWSAPATILNFSIGQGENTQTVINMVRFYQALVSNGQEAVPYLVAPRESAETRNLGLTAQQLTTLRLSMVAVLERGTAGRSRRKDLRIGGKTGTAQNSGGKDHGWFIGYAPADDPQIIIGSVMEFYEHGSDVAPIVVDAISRYVLGPEPPPVVPTAPPTARKPAAPADSSAAAPQPVAPPARPAPPAQPAPSFPGAETRR